MKYLILSDTHLSGHNFDQKQFDALDTVIAQADRVIINGDFFDAYLSSFDSFVTSNWSALFPALKKRKCIYIYGNHDRPEYMDERVTEFSVEQTYRKEIVLGGRTFVIQHGHNFAPDFDGRFPGLSYYLAWFYPRYHYHTHNHTWLYHAFLNYYDTNKNKLIHGEMKQSIKFFKKKNPWCQDNWFMCGHSHIHELDMRLRFINTGDGSHGAIQYALLDESGRIRLGSKKYVKQHEKLAKIETTTRPNQVSSDS